MISNTFQDRGDHGSRDPLIIEIREQIALWRRMRHHRGYAPGDAADDLEQILQDHGYFTI